MKFWVFLEEPWILRVIEQLVLNSIVPFSHHIYNISQYLIKWHASSLACQLN